MTLKKLTRRISIQLVFICLFSLPATSQEITVSLQAQKLHRDAIVFDSHSDTPLNVLDSNFDLGKRHDREHIDIPRMIEGGLDVQVFALFVSPRYLPNNAIKRTMDLMDAMNLTIENYSDKIGLALTATDAASIVNQGKIAVFYGIESGHAIENDLSALRLFHKLGVRYMTLTWMNTNEWADAAGDTARWGGLNEFGEKVVKEMNRIGMIIDVSHVSDDTFWDVMNITDQPVIASHSCCRAICDHFRNLSDRMLKALAENGGVIGINYYAGFLDPNYESGVEAVMEKARPELEALDSKYPVHNEAYQKARRKIFDKYRDEFPKVTIDKLIDHIDHVVKVAGIDHVGLGSDFDGISAPPAGLKDVSKLPRITQKLLDRGYNEDQIKKILGGNFMRVFKEVIGE